MWQDPHLRSLRRRWQLKYVDIEEDGQKVRWHEKWPRKVARIVPKSENVASEIKVDKMRRVGRTVTDGVHFGEIGIIGKLVMMEKLEKLEGLGKVGILHHRDALTWSETGHMCFTIVDGFTKWCKRKSATLSAVAVAGAMCERCHRQGVTVASSPTCP